MGYVLLWIESLAVSLLFVAMLVACLAQRGSRQSRWFFALLTVCAVGVGFFGLRACLVLNNKVGPNSGFLLLWITVTIFCIVGVDWALRRNQGTGPFGP